MHSRVRSTFPAQVPLEPTNSRSLPSQDALNTNPATISADSADPAAAKTQGRFTLGERVDIRGWQGVLEPAPHPLGDQAKPRVVYTDRHGTQYLHDRVSDLVYTSWRYTPQSLAQCYQNPEAVMAPTFPRDHFNLDAWRQRHDRTYTVSQLKLNLVRNWVSPRYPDQRPARLLDVGCNLGLFVMLAQHAGFDAHGLDLSQTAVDFGTRTIGIPNLRCSALETAGIPDQSFDALVIWDVLEHVYNLLEVTQHCARVLKPGGYFFAQVPNHQGITAHTKTFAARIGLTGGQYKHFGFPWHLYHFSPRSLDRLMNRVGLQTCLTASFSHWTKNHPDRRSPLNFLVRWLEQQALSDYVYVVARKPLE